MGDVNIAKSLQCWVYNLCKTVTAGLSELKRHSQSKKHQDMVKSQKTTRPITDVMGPTDTLKDYTKKVGAFIVEHNMLGPIIACCLACCVCQAAILFYHPAT